MATYKAFQEIVESYMDIIAMACKDEEIVPKDDYRKSLRKLTVFNREMN